MAIRFESDSSSAAYVPLTSANHSESRPSRRPGGFAVTPDWACRRLWTWFENNVQKPLSEWSFDKKNDRVSEGRAFLALFPEALSGIFIALACAFLFAGGCISQACSCGSQENPEGNAWPAAQVTPENANNPTIQSWNSRRERSDREALLAATPNDSRNSESQNAAAPAAVVTPSLPPERSPEEIDADLALLQDRNEEVEEIMDYARNLLQQTGNQNLPPPQRVDPDQVMREIERLGLNN